ncbi:site-specific integrase [Halomonas denitrificans]|uniref:site-specific integrase n=1 Tax=Halomonas denitrificans TaxID=370769 RepID=UPI00147334A4|nr:site-specific integrase [Halomonas denitrificans]
MSHDVPANQPVAARLHLPATGGLSVSDCPTISSLLESYSHSQRVEGVSEKTLDDKAAVANLLIRIIGDIPVSEVSMTHAKTFRDTALKLPPMVTRLLKGKTLEQVIAQSGKTISITTYNNYVKNLSTLFEHAIREEHMTRNPFAKMKMKQRQKANSFRSVFTSVDLQKIFNSVDSEKKAYRRWLPYLGFYTGARLGELCQLYLSDFKTVNGILCVHIQDTKQGQRLKTPESERLLPIHSRLIELGLMDYIESAKAQGKEMLFPELVAHLKHGYSATPSKWFGRLRKQLELNIDDGERKDFHSFRHTVADNLKQLGVAEPHIGGILGHSTGGITSTRYGKEYRPEVLQPYIEMIKP